MKSSNKNKLITIGRIKQIKGVGSKLGVLPLTYDPERFRLLKEIYLEKDGEYHRKRIEHIEISGNTVTLALSGIDSHEEAQSFAGCEIMIPRAESPPPPDGTYYHYQIIGLEVFTESGNYLGRVRNILETGSNDVYSVIHENREILIPAIEEVVQRIDLETDRIIIRPVKGLLDEV